MLERWIKGWLTFFQMLSAQFFLLSFSERDWQGSCQSLFIIIEKSLTFYKRITGLTMIFQKDFHSFSMIFSRYLKMLKQHGPHGMISLIQKIWPKLQIRELERSQGTIQYQQTVCNDNRFNIRNSYIKIFLPCWWMFTDRMFL